MASSGVCEVPRPRTSRAMLAQLGEFRCDDLAVVMEDVDLLILVEEVHLADDGDEIIAGPTSLGPDRTAGAGRLGAEEDALRRPLLYRRLEIIEVKRAGVEEQVFAQILLRQVMIALDEAIERTAAMTDHDLEAGEALEHIAVREKLGRETLLPHETDLVIVRNGLEPRIGAVGPLHDDRDLMFCAIGVDRVRIFVVHAG